MGSILRWITGISRRFPLRRVNSARVHPEDSPDGYLPVGQVIPPLAPVIRALVQYRAALQRRSLHHGDGVFGDFGVSFVATVAGCCTRQGGARLSVQGELLIVLTRGP